MLFKTQSPRTLFSRLVTIISWLTFSIVVLFAVATLVITYSFENVLFNERLKQAHVTLSNGGTLPYNFKHYNFSQSDTLDDLKPRLRQSLLEYVERQQKSFGKFQFEQSEYHYLVTSNGIIVYDTTNVTIIDRALEDVFLILAVLLLPVATLTYWIAKVAARHALKPFTRLTQLFTQSQKHDTLEADLLQEIEEQDVKNIAMELQSALQLKAQMLEQQVTFNKGLAHELRTPLQIMRHSVELFSECQPLLADSAAFLRLDNAIHRTIRLTNGLLWLTSEQIYKDKIDVSEAFQNSTLSLKELSDTHKIAIVLQVKENFRLCMPAVVLDLILFNLFNNVVTHASAIHANTLKSQTQWSITIDKNHIAFSNAIVDSAYSGSVVESPYSGSVVESAHGGAVSHNFGIGLELVSRLAQRFACNCTHTIQSGSFIATLSTR